jgi:hypothetical protein
MSAEPPPNAPPSGSTPPGAAIQPPFDDDSLETEEKLDAPSPLALRLLGVIFAATFIPWVGAKVACNRRDAPARPPLDLPVEVLSKQPKDAALELQQRAATNHFREAAELARGEASRELLAADARCQAEPKPCEERRARSAQIFTRAVVVRRGPLVAEARAESDLGDGQLERYAMRLEQDGGRWYVLSRTPYTGGLNDPVTPNGSDSAESGAPNTSPPGSPKAE